MSTPLGSSYRIRPIKFFRLRLLATPGHEIPDVLQEYKNEGRSIEEEIYSICIFSQGGITREEAFRLSPRERKDILKIIKKMNSPS